MVVLACPTCKSTNIFKRDHDLVCGKCRDTFSYDNAKAKHHVENDEVKEHKNRLIGASVEIINGLIEQLGECGVHFYDKDQHEWAIENLRYSPAVDKYVVEFKEVDLDDVV